VQILLPKEIQAGSLEAEAVAFRTIHLGPLVLREVLEEVLLGEIKIQHLRRRRQIQAVVLVQVVWARELPWVLVMEVQVLFV
jgi:hypothetical protein